MAKDRELNIVGKFDTEEIIEGAEKVKEAMDEATEAAQGRKRGQRRGGAVREAKKDWGALGGLFSGLLPRGLSRTISSFKRTSRGAARATQGFKGLQSVLKNLAGPIIALLIIGLEKLIENWDAVSNFLGLVSYGQRAVNEAMEESEKTTNRLVAASESYLDILMDTNRSLDERIVAQEKLARTIREIGEIDLNAEDAQEQIQAAFDMEVTRQGLEKELDAMSEAYETYSTERREKEEQIRELQERTDIGEYNRARAIEITMRQLSNLEEDYAEMLARRGIVMEELTDIEVEKMNAEEAAEQARNQRRRFTKMHEREMALSRENRLNDIEDKAARELEILREKEAEETRAFVEAGATDAELTTLRQYYADKRAVIREKEIEEQRRAREQEYADYITLQDKIFGLLGDEESKALAAVEERYARIIEAAAEAGEDVTELEAARDAELIAASERFTKMEQEQADRAAREEEDARRKAMMEEREITYALIEDEEALRKQKQLDALDDEYKEQLELFEKYQMDTTELTRIYEEKREEMTKEAVDENVVIRQEGLRALEQGFSDVFNAVQGTLERGSKAAKRMAVIEVLLSQAKSIAAAIEGAVKAANSTGPGAPFALVGYIASMVGAVVAGFAQVKAIMNEAGASGGGGRIGGAAPTQALVPSVSGGVSTEVRSMNVSAYVVQSDLQGATASAANMEKRVSL